MAQQKGNTMASQVSQQVSSEVSRIGKQTLQGKKADTLVKNAKRQSTQVTRTKTQGSKRSSAAKKGKKTTPDIAQAPKTRATKGTISIENVKGRLRMRFRAHRRQFTLTMGLSDTPEHRTHCKAIAAQIERDIVYGHFDSTLCKYKPAHLQAAKGSENLADLWERFTAHKKTQIAPTTLIVTYAHIKAHIERLPKKRLSDAANIKEHLLSTLKPYHCKHVLMMLSACCTWAVKAKLISENPFAGMAKEIRVPKDSRTHIDPFSAEERDTILAAIDSHPKYAHYAPFVRFLFFTGCRTSEAIGLKWKHIDARRILFCDTLTLACGKHIAKGTKTGEAREFPINAQLKALLSSIKRQDAKPDEFVFTVKKGRPIHALTFFNCVWTGRRKDGKFIPGIVSTLVMLTSKCFAWTNFLSVSFELANG